jgi:hypothetical protein
MPSYSASINAKSQGFTELILLSIAIFSVSRNWLEKVQFRGVTKPPILVHLLHQFLFLRYSMRFVVNLERNVMPVRGLVCLPSDGYPYLYVKPKRKSVVKRFVKFTLTPIKPFQRIYFLIPILCHVS